MQQSMASQQETLSSDTQRTLSASMTEAAYLKTPELEDVLVDLWSKELGIAQIDINQDFFDLGSKSLTIRHIQVKLQQFLQCSIPITVFFAHPTVKKLAHYLNHTSL